MKTYNKLLALGFTAFLLLGALPLMAIPAQAASSVVSVTTPYPRIGISSGQSINLNVNVANLTTQYQTIGLAVTGPDNWQATLNSGGYIIEMITLGPSETNQVSLNANPPAGVSAGTYNIQVRVTDQGGSLIDTLNVTVDIAKSTALGIVLGTPSPTIEGPSGQNFSYTVSVTNQTGVERDISFSATAPTDWNVTFKEQYQSTLIRALHFTSGERKSLDVTVSPPSNAAAGESKLIVQASSGSFSQTLNLGAVITGTYKLDLSTPDGLLNFNAPQGETTSVNLVVRNSGSALLNNFSFNSTNPTGWTITFDPNQIASISPGSNVQVSIKFKPPADAIPGDYSVTVYASAEPRATSANVNFRVTVLGSIFGGLVGLGIIVVVIAGLIVIFWRLGRR